MTLSCDYLDLDVIAPEWPWFRIIADFSLNLLIVLNYKYLSGYERKLLLNKLTQVTI